MDRDVRSQTSPIRSISATEQIFSVGLVLTIWFICRWTFGAGLAGSDDSFYIRYAPFDAPGTDQSLGTRLIFVWFVRLCFLAFGYSAYASWTPVFVRRC